MIKSTYLIYIFGGILIFGLFLSLKLSYISSDAPYYLSVARDITQNFTPYKDINLAYTPLMIYLNSIVYYFFSDPPYIFFLIFQYFFILLATTVLYFIIQKHVIIKEHYAVLLCVFFILSVLSCDGSQINLEIYSVLFVLTAIYFYYNQALILTGVFLALSFFCKQYGLLNFIPFFLVLSLSKRDLIGNMLKLSLGGIVPLFLFLFYFVIIQGINFMDLFNQLNGKEYIVYSSMSFPGIKDFFLGGKVFILLILPFLFSKPKHLSKSNWVLLVAGLIVNLLPVILQSFQHYYLNTFPFIFVLMAFYWKNCKYSLILQYSVILFLISGLWYARLIRYRSEFATQNQIAQRLEKIYPKYTEVFLYGKIRYLYLLNNYKNPLLKDVGYSYPFKPSRDQIQDFNIVSDTELYNMEPDKLFQKNKYILYVYER